jgi:4-methylaminobutanoate oxidase (formaldehyde-forming)
MIPTEFTAHVYEALIRAGTPHGLRHVGMFAMNACRLEKGFRHFGHDIAEEDTPYETGLGFAVDLTKPDFLGKAALVKQKDTYKAAVPDRLVAISVPSITEQDGPYLSHDETIWKNGEMVGYVTSGGWGHRLGQMIGLATLHRGDGVTKAWIDEGGFSVLIAGKNYPLHAQLAPLYDPKGEKMRG